MKRKVILISMIIFFVSIIGFSVLSIALENGTATERTRDTVENEANIMQTNSYTLSSEISGFVRDLEFVAEIMQKYGYEEDGFDNVAHIWQMFSNKERVFDQIRYIDANGDERIRVNYSTEGAYIVEQQELQNKKDRYYFYESIDLEQGQTYVSKLDLNIENGEIEQPIKPMIRIATPMVSDTGEHLGIVIVNYRAHELIETFNSIASAGTDEMYLLNENGYWFSNSNDKSLEWTFMYDNKQDINFSSIYPEEWQQIGSADSGTFSSDNGIFTYMDMSIESDDSIEIVPGEGDWILVSHISSKATYELGLLTSFWSNAVYLLIEKPINYISIVVISIMSAMLVALRTRTYERTRYLSEYDGMTKVLNRRTGMSLLSKIYREARRKSEDLSICFMDVNGLKEVNDILGHVKGDELLETAVNCIKLSIRKTDFLARIGGDEFLLILPDTDKAVAESVWQRVSTLIDTENDKNERDYLISISHGIKQFEFTANEEIDNVIKAADERMYEEKKLIKQNLKVLKKR